ELNEEGKLKAVGRLERRTFVNLTEETEVNGRTYMMTSDGLLVRKEHLTMPELQPLPKGLDPWEHWVDVSLSQQVLVAYEGTRPVYVTLVSTGRKGSKEEPFETPTGRWRIKSKHISTTMDGGTASDGNYSIQDVPWTMFFHGNYALHGAFWHKSFGRVRSHGCVNLGPSDARWLFFWTTPFLPTDWHGAVSTDDTPGSTVIVRK
ncbi:MAG: L,D-transpeptidase, partial [Nannocystaceae bacterium]